MYSTVISKSVQLISEDKEHQQRLTVCSVCSSDRCTTRTLDSVPGGNFISMNLLNCSLLYSPLQSLLFVYLLPLLPESRMSEWIINDNYLNSYHKPLWRRVYYALIDQL